MLQNVACVIDVAPEPCVTGFGGLTGKLTRVQVLSGSQMSPPATPRAVTVTVIVSEAGIPIDDLHALIHDAGPQRYLRTDGVHFSEEGYALLGEAVAKAVLDAIA